MIPVSSSAISAIGYDSDTQKMKIKFVQNRTYEYCHVPAQIFNDFLKTSSKGRYYDNYIKDKYRCAGY
jgi:hypothetical protein